MDTKTILNILKQASPFDIFLISFIALPFVFQAWLEVLEKLNTSDTLKAWSLLVILLAYILGIFMMIIGVNKNKKREIAKDQIINYLTRNSLTMMKLETIQNKINKNYSDEFLNSLAIHFPNEIRRAKLKGGVTGLARITEEPE